MKIVLALSKKKDIDGYHEILLTTQKKINGKVCRMRAKSEVYVFEEFFSAKNGVVIPSRKLIAPAVREWHIAAQEKLNGLLSAIARAEATACGHDLMGDWLRRTVEQHLHPKEEKEGKMDFYAMAEEYLRKRNFSYDHAKGFRVMIRAVARYEGFIRSKVDKAFVFDVETVCRSDMENFKEYLLGEKGLSLKYPALYARLLKNYPANVKDGKDEVGERGENAVKKMMKKLKAFFGWLYETGRTRNRPFDGFKIGSEKYGTPYYITVAERDAIASARMPSRHLEVQRDVFVFQCLVGCRVSDLMRLNQANVRDGILEYTPRKTKDEGEAPAVARVPLLPQALELMKKYKGVDARGRLMPCISAQKYNEAIKEVFTIAGVTRDVEVRDSLTGEIVLRPINEVASSHIARRTFIGNLYQQVQDPNLIGKMSGHVEGSTAFARYRKIEDDTLRKVIEKIK